MVLRDLIRDFKHFTASSIIKQLKLDSKDYLLNIFEQAAKDTSDRSHKVWRRTTHPKVIYSDKFKHQKVHYINFNAVHHKIVSQAEDYPYTSFHNYYCNHKPILVLR